MWTISADQNDELVGLERISLRFERVLVFLKDITGSRLNEYGNYIFVFNQFEIIEAI